MSLVLLSRKVFAPLSFVVAPLCDVDGGGEDARQKEVNGIGSHPPMEGVDYIELMLRDAKHFDVGHIAPGRLCPWW